jgi:hypothetical protein
VPGTPLVSLESAETRNTLDRSVGAALTSVVFGSNAGPVIVAATRAANLLANTQATVVSAKDASMPASSSKGLAGTLSVNVVLGGVSATVGASNLKGTNVTVAATDTSFVDATSEVSAISSLPPEELVLFGDRNTLSITGAIALNYIGWRVTRLALAALDVVLGSGTGLGPTEEPIITRAALTDTTVDASGDVSVAGTSAATINATVSNAATSRSAAAFGASSAAAGLTLATNQTSTRTRAVVAFATGGYPALLANTVKVGGALQIRAHDTSTIHSNVKLVSSSVTTNDGGMHWLGELIGGLTPTDHLSSEGLTSLDFGDTVRVVAGHTAGGTVGAVYRWMGPDESERELTTTNFLDLGWWQEVASTSLVPEVSNLTPSGSVGVAGVIVLNDVSNDVEATLRNARVDAGSLLVEAIGAATIIAVADVAAVATGGTSMFGSGLSLAIGARSSATASSRPWSRWSRAARSPPG